MHRGLNPSVSYSLRCTKLGFSGYYSRAWGTRSPFRPVIHRIVSITIDSGPVDFCQAYKNITSSSSSVDMHILHVTRAMVADGLLWQCMIEIWCPRFQYPGYSLHARLWLYEYEIAGIHHIKQTPSACNLCGLQARHEYWRQPPYMKRSTATSYWCREGPTTTSDCTWVQGIEYKV